MNRKNGKYFIVGLVLIVIVLSSFIPLMVDIGVEHEMNMDEKRDTFIYLKSEIQEDLMPHHGYRCCLEKPCTYCIEKTPGHGEGATCDCLSDVVSGVHPCGECIGEILEGHGNPYLAEYFAEAIAEKTGEKDAIMRIISEKYEISLEEQV